MKKISKLIGFVLLLALLTNTIPLVSAEEQQTFTGFDIRSFGSYPSNAVTDSAEIKKLEAELTDFDFEKDGTSYGFYCGDGFWGNGKMTAADYMFFTDITVEGIKYRAVYIKELRPYYSGYKTSLTGGVQYYQPTNGYNAGEVYYFRFEPLSWRILDVDTGLAVCEKCIDSRAFSEYMLFVNKNLCLNDSDKSANDYETSDIREFLNNEFYNTAFSEIQKKLIRKTDTGCQNTDSVFLLTSSDLGNENYFPTNNSREAENTDYALAMGACSSPRVWILRDSPDSTNKVYRVGNSGIVGGDSRVDATFTGIRPAIRVNLSENIFCSEDGFIYEIEDDGSTLILGYNGKETAELIIPTSLGGADVTEISPSAFAERKEVTTIYLPSTMQKIGDGIFGDNNNITCVVACCDITKLDCGNNAFFNTAEICFHKETILESKNASCTENGLTEGCACSLCNKIFKEQEVIPASGHTFDEGVITKDTSAPGRCKKTFTCKNCGEKTEIGFIRGDVDNDGSVTSADARLTLRKAVNLIGDTDVKGNALTFAENSRELLAADINGNSTINSADARIILRIAVNLPEE